MTIQFNRTIAFRNRNPLNIRYVNTIEWHGQQGNNDGFVSFKSFVYGYRAAVKILRNYNKRGLCSIEDIVSTWAPRSENNTDAYIKSVADYMNGVFSIILNSYEPSTKIRLKNREEVVNLLMAMTRVEMGANVAQLHALRPSAYVCYDLAVTSMGFFDGIR